MVQSRLFIHSIHLAIFDFISFHLVYFRACHALNRQCKTQSMYTAAQYVEKIVEGGHLVLPRITCISKTNVRNITSQKPISQRSCPSKALSLKGPVPQLPLRKTFHFLCMSFYNIYKGHKIHIRYVFQTGLFKRKH